MGEKVGKYGKAPGGHSSSYSKFLNRVLGLRDIRKRLYNIKTVGHPKNQIEREEFELPFKPIHEVTKQSIDSDSTIRTKLRDAVAAKELPDLYYDNPVVQASGAEDVFPVALFLDGVPYSNLDTVVGVWFTCMITQARHLVGVVRKK